MITNFINNNTVIDAAWLNAVDRTISEAIGTGSAAPTSPSDVKANLGLNNVDNTSDLNKPISTAQASVNAANTTALATKQDSATAVTKDASTGAANIPTGTTAQRPASPAQGMLRRNSQLGQWEGYDGSSWTGIGGASGGGGNPFCYENDIAVTADYTITTNKNAMSAGPITINNGITVTVPDGSVWSIV